MDRQMDRQTFWPLSRAQGGWAKNCAVAHPNHVNNSYTKFGWILPNALGDSMAVGRAEAIAISPALF